jgi:hypothetical protein
MRLSIEKISSTELIVGWLMSSRSPKDFWPIQLCVFIDFGLEKNKKDIWKLQHQKWPLNSRWPPIFDLLLKPTNRLFYQIFFICFIGCLNTKLLCKNFFLKNSRWRSYSIWRSFGIYF